MSEPFIDIHGQERRCGSLIIPADTMSVCAAFESRFEVMDDADIKRILANPHRIPGRVKYPWKKWLQNQFSKGSCNGYAAAGGLRKQIVRQNLPDPGMLSGADLYARINGNQDQGSALSRAMDELLRSGIAPESLVPWDMIYQHQIPASAVAARLKMVGLELFAVGDEQALKTALAKEMPCIVAVHAGNNFQRLDSRGIAGVDNGPGNHAVHCDDVAFAGGDWLYDMQNSWGPQYGTNGRAWLHGGSFAQTQRNHRFYTIGSVQVAANVRHNRA